MKIDTKPTKVDELKSDYEAIFSTEVGQRVLSDIKMSACVYRSHFSTDAMEMARDEGKRILALHIDYMATPREEKKLESAIR